MARRIGDEDSEYGLDDEHGSLIELGSGGGGRGLRHTSTSSVDSSKEGGSSATCRWITILFALALAGVYHLGLQEGKNEVKNSSIENGGVEDVEVKGGPAWNINEKEISSQPKRKTGTFTRKHIRNTRKQANIIIDMLEKYYTNKEQAVNMLVNSWVDAWNFDDLTPEQYATLSGSVVEQQEEPICSDKIPTDCGAAVPVCQAELNGYICNGGNIVCCQPTATNNEQTNTQQTEIPMVTTTIEKYNRSAKLVDTMARALVTDDQTTFLMGGIGSSVMAGHDNCHYDSYQTQMERLWQPVWEAAGMDFVFQNAGEGGGCGDSYENQHYCVKQNVSPDVDIVHYSWTYFEGGRAAPQHEDLIRWTQMLPKQPPVHVFNTGTMPAPGDYVDLTQYYAMYGYNSFYMKTGFLQGGHDYDAETKREKDPFDRFGRGFSGDGYHETTRYGELEDDEARKTSLGVVMRNWHPGPMGFQLTSDAFTYVYTQALLKALDMIEKDMNAGNDPRDTWSASKRQLLMGSDLPPPKYCDPEYCVVDEVPGCLNYELPTFGFWGARVEDRDDGLNPYAGQPQNWNVWHQDNDLWYMVGKQDQAVFQNREDKEICRHLDACGGISAQKVDDGMVVFRLPKMEVGLVVICGCCGKNVGNDLFLNNPLIEISFNTVPIDRSEWDIFPNAKCVRVLKRFPTQGRESETPTGHHYLGVRLLSDNPTPVRISHVITL